MTPEESKALKPCPFCGGEAGKYYPRGGEFVSCLNTNCFMSDAGYSVEHWNTRKALQPAINGSCQGIEKITVPAQPGLDPVFAFFEDIENGKGRVILICWDMAYTAYWGAMGDRTIKEFFADCGVDYIMGNLQGRHYKRGAIDNQYMKKIVEAVQRHLKAPPTPIVKEE